MKVNAYDKFVLVIQYQPG